MWLFPNPGAAAGLRLCDPRTLRQAQDKPRKIRERRIHCRIVTLLHDCMTEPLNNIIISFRVFRVACPGPVEGFAG